MLRDPSKPTFLRRLWATRAVSPVSKFYRHTISLEIRDGVSGVGQNGIGENKETDEGQGVLIGSGIGWLICNGFVSNSQHSLTLTAEILIHRVARFRVATSSKAVQVARTLSGAPFAISNRCFSNPTRTRQKHVDAGNRRALHRFSRRDEMAPVPAEESPRQVDCVCRFRICCSTRQASALDLRAPFGARDDSKLMSPEVSVPVLSLQSTSIHPKS